MSEIELQEALAKANSELQALHARVSALEKKTSASAALPNTNLLSNKFLTRAFTVLGHYLVASLIIALPIYALIFIVFIMIGSRF